jgi:hypothetical protein
VGDELASAADSIGKLAALLREHARGSWELRWADRLEEDARLIRRGDRRSLEHFLGSFGGMGSLNDIVLQPPAANDALWALREEAYENARAAMRSGFEHRNG